MKQNQILYSSVLTLVFALFSALAYAEDSKRAWQTSACFHVALSVWDKKSQGRYVAKYVVTSSDGRVFVAEKKGSDDSSNAEVIFPDNFRDKNSNLKAWIDCSYGESYSWEIYANDALIDSGTFEISRKRTKVRAQEHSGGEIARTFI